MLDLVIPLRELYNRAQDKPQQQNQKFQRQPFRVPVAYPFGRLRTLNWINT
jgi:hypothetical protein